MFDESAPTDPEESPKATPEESQDPSTAPTEPGAATEPALGGPGFTAEDAAKIKDVLEQIRKLTEEPQPDPIEIRIRPYSLVSIIWPRAVIYADGI